MTYTVNNLYKMEKKPRKCEELSKDLQLEVLELL